MRRLSPRIALAVGAVAAAVFAGLGTAANDGKVQICHGTASDTNPYVLIEVDESAIAGHFDGTAPGHGANNHPDFLAENGDCSTVPGEGGGE